MSLYLYLYWLKLYLSIRGKAKIWTQSGSRDCSSLLSSTWVKAMWVRPEGWVMDLKHCQGPILQLSADRSDRYRQPGMDDLGAEVPGKRRQKSFSQEMESESWAETKWTLNQRAEGRCRHKQVDVSLWKSTLKKVKRTEWKQNVLHVAADKLDLNFTSLQWGTPKKKKNLVL